MKIFRLLVIRLHKERDNFLGFTLIESVLVLGLVALMMSFGTIYGHHVTQVNAERQFWQELEQNWHASQVRAREGSSAINIRYVNGAIRFQWCDISNQRLYREDVTIPATISVGNFKKLQMMPNGYVQAGTQRFTSSLTHKTYLMKVQLGWGGYRIVTQ